jgi:hypothetical protein
MPWNRLNTIFILWDCPFKRAMFRSIVLDYNVTIKPLDNEDKVFAGGSLGNFRSVNIKVTLSWETKEQQYVSVNE